MAFRPMLSGILSGAATTALGDFAMTAGASGSGSDGYYSSQIATALGGTAYGSVVGDTSADGGTVEAIIDNGVFWILNGNQSATNVNIDGTDYALTYSYTDSGYDYYEYSPPDFVAGNTYQITVT